MWGWGLANVEFPDSVEIGRTLDEFIDRISFQNSVCYFHNLKFDGHFILDYVMKRGFTEEFDHDSYLAATWFRTTISDMGKFYAMEIRWENGNITKFKDSLKKLPMSVSRIAKAFKLDELKGDIDYEAERPTDHKITDEEADYIRRDVSIVAKAMRQALSEGMTKLTVASDSMAEYKRVIGAPNFVSWFPTFSQDMDAEIRKAYRGGFTYKDKRRQGLQGGGIVLDVNSLYPSIMVNCDMPYGTPDYYDVYAPLPGLTIFAVTFVAKIKPHHIPCIQVKGTSMFQPTEYLEKIDEPVTMMVTNVDWQLYNDHYDITVISYGGMWRFAHTRGMFDGFIDKWMEVKAKETGGKREIAKLHLNSLYGKFASNPNVTSKHPKIVDGAIRYSVGQPETRNPIYTPVGVFITSWARDLTIRAAQENYDTFAYADTDSLHLMRPDIPQTIDVHPSRLGAWKHEYDFDAAYYIRAKAYLERMADSDFNREQGVTAGTYVNRIAGLPERVSGSLTFDDLVDGKVLHGKLAPVSVPGGLVLKDVPFELKL